MFNNLTPNEVLLYAALIGGMAGLAGSVAAWWVKSFLCAPDLDFRPEHDSYTRAAMEDQQQSDTPYCEEGLINCRSQTCGCVHTDEYRKLFVQQRAEHLRNARRCMAVQTSDQMSCSCGLVWDMNDSNPPRCPLRNVTPLVPRRQS